MFRLFLSIAITLVSLTSFAQIKLPALVGDNMVLQRDKPIKLWGYASAREQVQVTFLQKTYSTITQKDGRWEITLPKTKAGGPYSISLNNITLNNIMIGDVWLLSGQSNMEMEVRECLNAKEEIAAADYPDIRLFSVNKNMATSPKNDTYGKWQACSSETVGDFSAVGYFFARDLRKKGITVPFGLIDASWGGTLAETWISPEALATLPEFAETAHKTAQFNIEDYNKQQKTKHGNWLKEFDVKDIGTISGTAVWASSPIDANWRPIQLPGNFEFKKIDELFNFDGIVWFRKDFEIDNLQDLKLHLGNIMNSDVTYVNGHKVGEVTDVWAKIRTYDVPQSYLKPDKNTIAVKVSNYGGDGGFRSEPEELFVELKEGKKIALAGEWQYRIAHKIEKYDRPEKELSPNTLTSLLSNGMITPIEHFNIKGVLWYQGEANWANTQLYQRTFKTLIHDWRARFRNKDLPFLYVQLAGYQKKRALPSENSWSELREAQAMALTLPHTAMITAMDLGDEADIHPKNKQEVGRRLSLEALRTVYGQKKLTERSPYFKSVKWGDYYALVKFEGIANGLNVNGSSLKGFEITEDGKFYQWATAELINKNTVKVYLSTISLPKGIRYAWEENPEDANLQNSYNLPALPFRVKRSE